MTEVHQLPHPDQVEQEAADWIARLHAENVSEEDRARFAEWRAAHPAHARAYDAMSAAWRAFNAAGPLVRAVSFGQSINEAITPSRKHWRGLVPSALAAGLLIAAVSLYLVRTLTATAFQTAIGEHASISLPDGSVVELNSNTRIRVDYSEHLRVIRLDHGEAFFKVIHDASRPFWVYGGGSWVRDVGTAFDVYLRPQDVRVTVSEGTVQVGFTEGSVTDALGHDAGLGKAPKSVLTAGEQADVENGTTSIRLVPRAEIRRSLAWRTGKLSFERQPLEGVIAELSRYTTLKIIVSDDRLRQLPVGGTFQASPEGAETLISMLKDGFGLNIRREPGRVYVEDGSPPSSQ